MSAAIRFKGEYPVRSTREELEDLKREERKDASQEKMDIKNVKAQEKSLQQQINDLSVRLEMLVDQTGYRAEVDRAVEHAQNQNNIQTHKKSLWPFGLGVAGHW